MLFMSAIIAAQSPGSIRTSSRTTSIAARSAALPDIHRDPIDRVIVATAIEQSAELVSKDELVARYPGLQVRWDQ